MFHMSRRNSLHFIWFFRYSIFKFWWRHNDIIMTSQIFFEQLSKRTKWQGFICPVAIACILHGSLVIRLLNVDDVIMTSHNFFEQPSKRTKWQGFICAVVVACILHGSLVIRLLNFDDVIVTSSWRGGRHVNFCPFLSFFVSIYFVRFQNHRSLMTKKDKKGQNSKNILIYVRPHPIL